MPLFAAKVGSANSAFILESKHAVTSNRRSQHWSEARFFAWFDSSSSREKMIWISAWQRKTNAASITGYLQANRRESDDVTSATNVQPAPFRGASAYSQQWADNEQLAANANTGAVQDRKKEKKNKKQDKILQD